MRTTLIPFPESLTGPVERIEVEVIRTRGGLALTYRLAGTLRAIRIPAPAETGRTDGLWEHTCFEAFVSTDDGYREFNLSPSGQWASYRFDAYREGMRHADEVVVIAGLDAGSDHAALAGRIELPADARRLALSAVIETVNGEKTYWALAHPSDKPDFHHPDSFVLDLP